MPHFDSRTRVGYDTLHTLSPLIFCHFFSIFLLFLIIIPKYIFLQHFLLFFDFFESPLYIC